MKNRIENMKAKVKAVRNKKGFTLIELIVVIAVLGILVLLAAPKFLGYTQDANVATLKADAKVLENASLVYHVEQEVDGNPGAWPVTTTAATLDVDGDGTADYEGFTFDESLLGDKVKSLKGEIADYALTEDGDVFLIDADGFKDSKGKVHYGVDIVK